MPREHLLRIDGNKGPGAAGQNIALGINDFSHIDVATPVHALFLRGNGECMAQRNRLEILDFHGTGEGQHVAKFIHFAHGFVQDGGDNAAVGVSGRTGIFARQLEVANGLARFFVQRELQPHALGIVMPAAKTMVLAWFGFALNCVAV